MDVVRYAQLSSGPNNALHWTRGKQPRASELMRSAPMRAAVLTLGIMLGFTAIGVRVARACAGDCDLNGLVTVDEVVKAVNVALGLEPLSQCVAADTNKDGSVTIDEIVTAVIAVLEVCEQPAATASPVPTPTPPGGCVTALSDPTPMGNNCNGYRCFWYGGSECIDVSAPTDCCWAASIRSDYTCPTNVAITSGQQGCSAAAVCFTIGFNPCAHTDGSILVEIGDRSIHITQAHATPGLTPTVRMAEPNAALDARERAARQ